MHIDRDKIVRDDFPKVRKGYEPEAVRDHLQSIADAAGEHSKAPLAETAAERVGSIIEAAERQAAEIEREARDEAERIVEAARGEAKEQVDRAQAAVSRLVAQADDLRSAIGKLGSDIASQLRREGDPGGGAERKAAARPAAQTTEPEIVPEPARVPEPEPPREPEPEPPREPEPQPPPSPQPGPEIVPEPQPPGPEMSTGSPSTENLLAQLRGDAPSRREAGGNGDESRGDDVDGDESSGATAPSPAGPGADVAAARLVAMKMALDGASRDEIERHLADKYELSNTDELLDDVLARAKR